MARLRSVLNESNVERNENDGLRPVVDGLNIERNENDSFTLCLEREIL